MYKQNISKLKRIVKSLIRTRNQLFTVLKVLQEFDFQSGIYRAIQKSDYVSCAQIAKKVEGTPIVDSFKIWGLKKKDAQSDIYKDDELSE